MCYPDLIAASMYARYSVGPSILPRCTICIFPTTNMIQVCSKFHRARVFIINTRLDEIAHRACARADVHLLEERETGSACIGSADHSQLDVLGVWHKSVNVHSELDTLGLWYKTVNVGWEKSSGSPHWSCQTD